MVCGEESSGREAIADCIVLKSALGWSFDTRIVPLAQSLREVWHCLREPDRMKPSGAGSDVANPMKAAINETFSRKDRRIFPNVKVQLTAMLVDSLCIELL